VTRSADLLESLRGIVFLYLRGKYSEAGALPCDRDLFELGLDSLTAVRVLLDVEEAFGVEFAEDEIKVELFASLNSLHTALVQRLELPHT
jgi:acyl carrier protein